MVLTFIWREAVGTKGKQVDSILSCFVFLSLLATKQDNTREVEIWWNLRPLLIIRLFCHINGAHPLYWWTDTKQLPESGLWIPKVLVLVLAAQVARCLTSDESLELSKIQLTHM